jgi:hypothetical protein
MTQRPPLARYCGMREPPTERLTPVDETASFDVSGDELPRCKPETMTQGIGTSSR